MEAKEFKKIVQLLRPIFSQKGVTKAVIFGSASRGSETRKSDLDLMIVVETKKRFFDRYDDFEQIYSIIKDRAVDILIYTPEELESISHRPFIMKILKEGQTIYEH